MAWNKIKYLLYKEIKGVLRDRKTFLVMIVFPLLFLPGLIGGITYFQMQTVQPTEVKNIPIYIENSSYNEDFRQYIGSSGKFKIVNEPLYDLESALSSGQIALYIIIDKNFNEVVSSGKSGKIEVLYNNTYSNSNMGLNEFRKVVSKYENEILDKRLEKANLEFDYIYPIEMSSVNKATDQEMSGELLGSMVPLFVMISIFLGTMTIGINITSGEKEKGTLSALLVTKLSRSEIVVAKLLTLIVFAVFSAMLNIVGLVIAYKYVFNLIGTDMEIVIDLSGEFLFQIGLLFVILAFLISGIIILIGSFARSMKEGNSYVMPIYFFVLVIAVLADSGAVQTGDYLYYIPFLNITFLLRDIFKGNINMTNYWVTVITVLIFGGVVNYFSIKLFKREEIIFRT